MTDVASTAQTEGNSEPTLEGFKSMRHVLVGTGPELANLKVMLRRNGCADTITITPEGLVDADVFATNQLNATYLFADGVDDELISAVLQRIRNDKRENTSLQPVMVLASSMKEQRAVSFLNMGIDYSIISPISETVIANKIGMSVDKPFKFFRTQTYFGPDRRRATKTENAHHMRGTGVHEWQEISIIRCMNEGCYVRSMENKTTGGEQVAA